MEQEGGGGMLSMIISTLFLLIVITLITGNLFGLSTYSQRRFFNVDYVVLNNC